MPRRHCKTCGNPLHADDTHAECVTLGEIPRWCCAQQGWLLALQVFQSCLSALAVSFLFRERLHQSRPPVSFLPGICEKKTSCRGFERPVTSELPSAQWLGASPSLQRERAFAHPLHSTWSRDMISFSASDGRNWWQTFFLVALDTVLSGTMTDPAILPSSSSHYARLRADEELIGIMTKAVNELGLEWSPLRSHLAAGWTSVFSWGAIKPPSQRSFPSSPKFIRAHDIMARPPLFSHPSICFSCSHIRWWRWRKRIRAPASSGHLCPPTAIGWKMKANHPSKPCRATFALAGCAYSAAGQAASALHSMAVLQVFQAKMLANEEAGLDSASLRDLRSTTDLALRATKATAQAIGRSISSLIVLEHHLWLTMMEMKEADLVPFLHAPVSSGSLFGPAVEGFAEHFTEAQKSSQAMWHFLPKRTSPSSASSRPRPAPKQIANS